MSALCLFLATWARLFIGFAEQDVPRDAWRFGDDWTREERALLDGLLEEVYTDRRALLERLTRECGERT